MLVIKKFDPRSIIILDTDTNEETKIDSPALDFDYDVIKKIIES